MQAVTVTLSVKFISIVLVEG